MPCNEARVGCVGNSLFKRSASARNAHPFDEISPGTTYASENSEKYYTISIHHHHHHPRFHTQKRPSNLQRRGKGLRTHTSITQHRINQKRGTKHTPHIPSNHMSQENRLINKRIDRMIPRKIKTNKMTHQPLIPSNTRPRPRRNLNSRLVAKVMNIHNLTPKRRHRILNINNTLHIFEFRQRLRVTVLRTESRQSAIDIRSQFTRRRILSDEIK